jgi:hypothetical protein
MCKTGYIYKLYSNDNDLIYIGSTTRTIHTRYNQHKNKKFNTCSSRELFKNSDNVLIILLDTLIYTDITELRKLERTYISGCRCVNKNNSYRSLEEKKEQMKEQTKDFYQKNKEKMKEYDKIYRGNNKEHLKQYQKEYYEKNKETRKERNKQHHKEYYEKNKQRHKEYYKYRRSPIGQFLRSFNL